MPVRPAVVSCAMESTERQSLPCASAFPRHEHIVPKKACVIYVCLHYSIIVSGGDSAAHFRPGVRALDFELLKSIVLNAVPWIGTSGLRVDILEERHVRLSVPVREKHLNHVGIVWAGTHFMLMEVAGAALFGATYDFRRFVPVNKGMTIRYHRPAVTDLICDLSISAEDAAAKLKPVEGRGRGDWIIDVPVMDAEGNTVSSASCNFYIIPTPDSFLKKE